MRMERNSSKVEASLSGQHPRLEHPLYAFPGQRTAFLNSPSRTRARLGCEVKQASRETVAPGPLSETPSAFSVRMSQVPEVPDPSLCPPAAMDPFGQRSSFAQSIQPPKNRTCRAKLFQKEENVSNRNSHTHSSSKIAIIRCANGLLAI